MAHHVLVPAPSYLSALTTWQLDVAGLATILTLAVAYLALVHRVRRAGGSWSRWRTAGFLGPGLGSWALLALGPLGVWSPLLRWAFVTRCALLLVVVPLLLALGRPVELLHQARPGWPGSRLLDRAASSMLLGPGVVLVLFVTVLTPLAGIVRTTPALTSLTVVTLPLVGLLGVLPLAGATDVVTSTSLALGFLLAFGELVVDAVPGLALRLQPHVIDAGVRLAAAPAWLPSPLRDQQLAADMLWGIAETADLPLLAILFVRWIRIDQAEAARVDALLDAAELRAATSSATTAQLTPSSAAQVGRTVHVDDGAAREPRTGRGQPEHG